MLRLQAGPASAHMVGEVGANADLSLAAQPALRLYDVDPTVEAPDHLPGSPAEWLPADDLVRASADDRLFAVEVESDGSAALRFGDDETGRRPNAGTVFDAVYRLGTGVAGNIGRDTIRHCLVALGPAIGTTDTQTIFDGPPGAIIRVRNPLVGVGGTEPESIQTARLRAPEVFDRQLRAVTPDDYVERLESHPLVQRAVVSRLWTGSWPTLFCTVDLVDGVELNDRIEAGLRQWIEPRRTMGHDIEIDEPEFVAVEVELCVGIDGSAQRSLVARDLTARLSSAPGGLFHPDRMTFGQRLHLSELTTEVQRISGVREVDIRTFRRLGSTDTTAIDRGFIEVTGREIAVLANDPNHPERGSLTFTIEGGR